MSDERLHPRAAGAAGFSLLEVLVSIAILLVGLVMIIYFFPQMLRSTQDAEYHTKAALLAQLKAEEIQRDDDITSSLVTAISELREPTRPITFSQEPDLSYSFASQTILYPGQSPEGDPDVPRVIISRTRSLQTGPAVGQVIAPKDVLYELRFGS